MSKAFDAKEIRKCDPKQVDPRLLASAWAPMHFDTTSSPVKSAIQRTYLLLENDDATVPFLCRYRAEAVDPLDTTQVHLLKDLVEKHDALTAVRVKAVSAIDDVNDDKSGKNTKEYIELRQRMLVSTSKSELDDLYSPYKPLAKGSIAERVATAYPDVVNAVDAFWTGRVEGDELRKILTQAEKANDKEYSPKEAAIYILGTKIAGTVQVYDEVLAISREQCVCTTKEAKKKSEKSQKEGKKRSNYEHYFDYSSQMQRMKAHEVLAIRRAVSEKEIKMTNAVPSDDYVKRQIKRALPKHVAQGLGQTSLGEAIDDAWSRLLKRRSSSAVWKEKIVAAEERGIQ